MKTPKPKSTKSAPKAKKAAVKSAPATPDKPKAKKAAVPKAEAPKVAKEVTAPAKTRVVIRSTEGGDVAVAGTFNDWQPKPLKPVKKGGQEIVLNLLPGSYEYRLVINGHYWMADPACENSVPNPFGGHNSLLTVK